MTEPKKPGRPSKLTPKLMGALCKHISEGVLPETACAIEGVNPRSYYRWMQAGESDDAEYRQFCQLIKEAKGAATKRRIMRIEKASEDSWQAAAWLLERTEPDLYSLRSNLNVHQSIEPLELEVKEPVVDDDRIGAILAILQSVGAIPAIPETQGVGANMQP